MIAIDWLIDLLKPNTFAIAVLEWESVAVHLKANDKTSDKYLVHTLHWSSVKNLLCASRLLIFLHSVQV